MPRPDLKQMLVSQGVVASPSTVGGGMVWAVLERLDGGEIGKGTYRSGHSKNMKAFVEDVLAVMQERDKPFENEDAA